jgi:hypothetical protein
VVCLWWLGEAAEVWSLAFWLGGVRGVFIPEISPDGLSMVEQSLLPFSFKMHSGCNRDPRDNRRLSARISALNLKELGWS